MAEMLTIARPYAEAAFKIAREHDSLPSWSDALARLAAVASNQVTSELVGNPSIEVTRIASLISECAGDLSKEQRNFVNVLAQNARITALPVIATQFEVLRNAHEGVIDASITSAFPLSEAQVVDIIATLRAKYRSEVKANVSVDSELIGGISIQIGDEVMDASVRGKLAQLAGVFKA